MKTAPSALGTLLVQRLETVLGTTLAQHAHLMRALPVRTVAQTERIARTRASGSLTEPRETHQAHEAHQARAPQSHAHRLIAGAMQAGLASGPSQARISASAALHSAHTRLGNAARLILPLLSAWPERAPALMGQQPLMSARAAASALNAAPQAAPLAHTLAQTVAASGLFYESHLLALARGARTPAQLLEEPQARFAQPAQPATETEPLPPEVALLVRQQLDVLAWQRWAWQGLAWPGAALQWEIERRDDPHPQHSTGREAATRVRPAHWRAQLRLRLPRLGAVHAQLDWYGETLSVQLHAPASAAALRAQADHLLHRYQRSGLRLTHLHVVEHIVEHADDAA